LLAGLFAFYSVRLSWQSWSFHDISTASDATPLWIPQLAMALGTVVLAHRLHRRADSGNPRTACGAGNGEALRNE
jgi:hypothetical protein